jgi:cellulose biosynthesis protein BcsQ
MNPFVALVQQYGPLFGGLTALATVLGLAFTIYKAAHDRHLKDLTEQLQQKDLEIDRLKREGYEKFQAVNEQLQDQLKRARDENTALKSDRSAAENDWQTKLASMRGEHEHLRQTVETLTQGLEEARNDLTGRDRADQSRINLLKRAMRLQGKVWERKVLQSAPRFRPLAQRHTPVISVLNLKGGVGKTTVTANLGAALSAKGYRTLLVDLDLQGSLSSLFMSESALKLRSEEGLLLQHFLLNVAERRKANLLDCCVPIFDGRSAIVPNADSMAYAELNLTMQWLLRMGKRDTRFLLRKAFHQKRLTKQFDVVLLDCPPLFNTCCVNALAASDYMIIPVLPSRKAAERVPLLLERLQSLHRVINPQLQVLGVLLNRTHGTSLTAWEQDLWADMLENGKDRWTMPVPAFETFIRQTTEVRDGEVEFSPPAAGSELHGVFSRLAAELEARLPGDCRRTASTPIGPG